MAYGKLIPELGSRKKSHYGFVNETAIRVGAGIMFTIGFFTFLSVFYAGKYEMALYVVGTFWLDFLLKVINPDWSIFGNIAKFLTKHKEPVRVGAIQKRFARGIGLVFASIVLIMLVHHNFFMTELSHADAMQQIIGDHSNPTPEMHAQMMKLMEEQNAPAISKGIHAFMGPMMHWPITPPMMLCLICLTFMWLEAIMGYCVGCKIFEFLVKHNFLKNHDHQTCPDGACSL